MAPYHAIVVRLNRLTGLVQPGLDTSPPMDTAQTEAVNLGVVSACTIRSSMYHTLLVNVVMHSVDHDRDHDSKTYIAPQNFLQVPLTIQLPLIGIERIVNVKHRRGFKHIPGLCAHRNLKRSPSTPIAVTAAPAPAPCTISGRAPYRSV